MFFVNIDFCLWIFLELDFGLRPFPTPHFKCASGVLSFFGVDFSLILGISGIFKFKVSLESIALECSGVSHSDDSTLTFTHQYLTTFVKLFFGLEAPVML